MIASAVTRAMPDPSTPISPSDALDNCEFVHGLLEQCLVNDELSVPLLPEVAVRVVRMGPQDIDQRPGTRGCHQRGPGAHHVCAADRALRGEATRIADRNLAACDCLAGLRRGGDHRFHPGAAGQDARRQGSAAQGAAVVAALAGERAVVASVGAHGGPRTRHVLPVRAGAQHRQGGHPERGA